MRKTRARLLERGFSALIVWAILLGPAAAQDTGTAAKVYKDCAKSVLLLKVRSDNGEVVAQATGFVIEGGLIVTNEHVARRGKVFVESGIVLVPTKTQRTDVFNDLAILTPEIEISVAALPVAKTAPSPGEQVYTISNPEGLEKSISTGVVSSIRDFEGRRLIQITAPISPGSSGGAVLNGRGEVVGVAVGGLKEGQNLNFAVPSEKVLELVGRKTAKGGEPLSLLSEVDTLKTSLFEMDYSEEADSTYQLTWAKIRERLDNAMNAAGENVALLVKVSDESRGYDNRVAIAAAEKAVKLESSPETEFALGQALMSARYQGEEEQKRVLIERAEQSFRNCLKLSKGPNAEASFSLGQALDAKKAYVEAERCYLEAYRLFKAGEDTGGQAKSLRSLVKASYNQGDPAAGDQWFQTLTGAGFATAWDWSSQGERLEGAGKSHEAGTAYANAASKGSGVLWRNWLEAARMFWRDEADYDSALYCARQGLEAGAGKEDSESTLAYGHRLIADILNKRGVFQEALNHARESIALKADDAWAYDAQAEALIGLKRFLEATKASLQAIRLSDGKFASLHFRLGAAYFNLENWELAKDSFEKAAELDKTEESSPYNVALCCWRLGYYSDAARWFEEVLRRNPRRSDREDILKKISLLKRTA